MTDPVITNTFHEVNKTLNNTLLILGGSVLLFWILYRIYLYYFIERGWKYKIKDYIQKNKFYKYLKHVFSPDIEKLLEDSENKFLKIAEPEITYDKTNKATIIKYKEEKPIRIEGKRGVIPFFFSENREKQNSYKDYNSWVEQNNLNESTMEPSLFRQEINEINKRLAQESDSLESIIHCVDNSSNTRTKYNLYKFQIKYKEKPKLLENVNNS